MKEKKTKKHVNVFAYVLSIFLFSFIFKMSAINVFLHTNFGPCLFGEEDM